jgi:hypothetical protein
MTMMSSSRRQFLRDLGAGALAVGGAGYASAMSPADSLFGCRWINGEPLDFGLLEPLAAWMQNTDADQMVAGAIKKLGEGTELKTLVAAGALANARTFGGEDYVGFHCAMALLPAYQMSAQMPKGMEALPVLKVLHRNTTRIRVRGGRRDEVMRQLPEQEVIAKRAKSLLEVARSHDLDTAERVFDEKIAASIPDAYEALQPLMRDNIDVHQVVLTWRSFDLLQLTGQQHAQTMLRQCVRHYIDRDRDRAKKGRAEPSLRRVLPRLLDEHKLHGKTPGKRTDDGTFAEELAGVIMRSGRDEAANAAANALADGFSIDVVGEALSRAGVRLLLGDPGMKSAQPGKPKGSVHGASVGVHACDSAQAWRNISRVCGPANAIASLIAGAWHTGGQLYASSETPVHLATTEEVARIAPSELPTALRESVAKRDQKRAAAIGARWQSAGHAASLAFDAVIEDMSQCDGALHHEKFFRTCCEGHAQSPEVFRADWLAGVARVAASGHGVEAPGYAAAVERLGV